MMRFSGGEQEAHAKAGANIPNAAIIDIRVFATSQTEAYIQKTRSGGEGLAVVAKL